MVNANMEITVNIDEVCNDALYEFAANFYKKTGVRLRSVHFDWISRSSVDAPGSGYFLTDVTVTSSGSGKP